MSFLASRAYNARAYNARKLTLYNTATMPANLHYTILLQFPQTYIIQYCYNALTLYNTATMPANLHYTILLQCPQTYIIQYCLGNSTLLSCITNWDDNYTQIKTPFRVIYVMMSASRLNNCIANNNSSVPYQHDFHCENSIESEVCTEISLPQAKHEAPIVDWLTLFS